MDDPERPKDDHDQIDTVQREGATASVERPYDRAARPERKVDPSTRHLVSPRRRRRYIRGAVLGRGGMGEVRIARDRRIGRSVAIKALLDEAAARPESKRRFLREARVQGQLEHPSIVPVYDLGSDRGGNAYFTMKRVAGETLGEVLLELRRGNADLELKYTLRRLLSNFQQVCLALEYAHSHGVVHRDVKPGNIMFGDFGEVYVLDWGIAKLVENPEPESSTTLRLAQGRQDGATQADEVLGTIGYMAPEQITSATTVDARADVYALGAVLFQMLTLEPLHGFGDARERARSTQLGSDARASLRAPGREIPPELDAICVRATELDPGDRYRTARALHDAIEAFLDGDRDARLRAELAERHVENARASMAHLESDESTDAEMHRTRALREAGRALALHPSHEVAAGLLTRLMLEAPREVPVEVHEATERIVRTELRHGVRLASLVLFGVVGGSIFLPLLGQIRSPETVALVLGAIATAAIYGLLASSFRRRFSHVDVVVVTLPLCVAIAGFSMIVGPLFMPPVLAIALTSLLAISHFVGRYRIPLIALVAASWLVPATLDWIGVGPEPAYRFEDDVLTVVPRMMDLPEGATRGGLAAVFLAVTVAVAALLWRTATWIADSREKLQVHAWHLERVFPSAPAAASSPPKPSPPLAPGPATSDETRDELTRARNRSGPSSGT